MAPYGFIGTGAITAAIVEGVSAPTSPAIVQGLSAPAIFLSPRSRTVSQDLASRFPNVQICDTNQDVLESATAIVLAVRPQIARDVLADLTFHPEHIVISAMAGVSLAQLSEWTAPAKQLIRVIPLPSAASGDSLTVMYPDNPTARELFNRVGGLVTPTDETALEVFSAATATFAAHLDYLATITAWLANHGVDEHDATAYTRHIFGQLGQSLLHRTDSFAVLTNEHMTPGGINEQVLTDLRRNGVPDLVRRALDEVLTRLRT
ncbi:NAD(P)-binding domain-containing protein [Kibdelosporangium philippinense]|uniref:NAD(P)-binding domain-containing protein n=1 Tax=Kibdelosporangium philippinense TaxID=211113 RepID=A0ABS8ZMC3_9PSEU|nr:NAD(P)-binding domain-containing protein [Kibdelosporangium philippinense]MCE7007608.1 NAD(P)-binding domain-containing protein [Kibdelosporangium philippinense]